MDTLEKAELTTSIHHTERLLPIYTCKVPKRVGRKMRTGRTRKRTQNKQWMQAISQD